MTDRPTLVRMPPSPTGALHLGTARTALFNWLFAKKTQGGLIFRWEDTDLERSKPAFEEEILAGLKWLGMDFVVGADAFYRQTECADQHKAALMKLWEAGAVFPCFVTKEELNALRDKAAAERTNFVFWSPFRDAPRAELEAQMESGSPYVWRLKTPRNEVLSFQDEIRGTVATNTETLGDFVVARANGAVLYVLANVLDDAHQGVTHVIRGEDHISNTPKQVLVYRALGYPTPVFAHIPLVLNHARKKLSKRNVEPGVAVLVKDFQRLGFLPEGVINGLAFLGWTPQNTENEVLSLDDLSDVFSLDRVQKSPAQYDFAKMRWFNRQWMNALPLERIVAFYKEWEAAHGNVEYRTHEHLTQAIAVLREKAVTFAELAVEMKYLLEDPGFDSANMKKPDEAKTVLPVVLSLLKGTAEDEWNAAVFREKAIEEIKALGMKNGPFLSPWRVALSNHSPSVGPFQACEILGKEESIRRIERALDAVSASA